MIMGVPFPPISVIELPGMMVTFSVSGAQRLRRLRLWDMLACPSSLSSPDRLLEAKQVHTIILLVI
jgi:hypothetical protein